MHAGLAGICFSLTDQLCLCQAWEARKSSRVNWTFWSALDLAPQGPAQTRQDEPDLDGFGQGESDRGRPCSGGVERKLLMLNGSVTDTGKPKSKSKFGAVASPTRAQKRHLRHARRLGRMPFAASSYLNTAKLRALRAAKARLIADRPDNAQILRFRALPAATRLRYGQGCPELITTPLLFPHDLGRCCRLVGRLSPRHGIENGPVEAVMQHRLGRSLGCPPRVARSSLPGWRIQSLRDCPECPNSRGRRDDRLAAWRFRGLVTQVIGSVHLYRVK